MTLASIAAVGAMLVAQSSPATLAGVAVGATAKDVVAAHRGTAISTPWGPAWTWKAAGIGVVRLVADEDGTVGIVDVVLAPSTQRIDLPGAAGFPINGGNQQYTSMSSNVESDDCKANASGGSCFAYTTDDGELVLQFAANASLHEALWGARPMLKTLGIITPGTSI